jgi:hypothetical protein
MAPSTDDYPHYYYYDSTVYNPDWGALIFDDYRFIVRTEVVLIVQSTYYKKFGFYPQKYWYIPGDYQYSSHKDVNPQMQKRPKMGWRI